MRHQRISQEELYSCRCSTTSLVEHKTMKKNVWQMLKSSLYMQEYLEQDSGHFSVRYSISEDSPQREWDKMAEKMMLAFAESGHTSLPCHESIVQRSAQKRRRWKIVDTLLCRFRND